MMKLFDTVQIVDNLTGHPFSIGEFVRVYRIIRNNTYDVCNNKGDCWTVRKDEITTQYNNPMQAMMDAVLNTAKKLLKAQNKVTTLEIKAEVIKTYPQYFWTQAYVSAIMDDAHKAGMFTYYDTTTGGNTHRVYSDPTVKPVKTKKTMKTKTAPKVVAKRPVSKVATKTISKSKALELMETNKGHFFTATFIAKKGERTINCQYLKDQTYSKLGYVKVKEAAKAKAYKEAAMKAKASKKAAIKEDSIRQINLQTLRALKIAGNSYKVK